MTRRFAVCVKQWSAWKNLPSPVQLNARLYEKQVLHLVFFDGRRSEVELLYKNPPLTEKELERSLGIDPNS